MYMFERIFPATIKKYDADSFLTFGVKWSPTASESEEITSTALLPSLLVRLRTNYVFVFSITLSGMIRAQTAYGVSDCKWK